MYRVTTPTHTFTLPIQTSSCKEVQVTYKQNNTELVFHYQDGTLPDGMTFDGKDVIIRLSQEQTKAFKPFIVQTQVRVLTTGNDAYASQVFNVSINEVLNDEVLTDGN